MALIDDGGGLAQNAEDSKEGGELHG